MVMNPLYPNHDPTRVTGTGLTGGMTPSGRKGYKFKIIEKGALEKTRDQVLEIEALVTTAATAKRITKEEAQKRIQAVKDKEAIATFLYSGYDYKGQAQYATAAKGTRGTMAISFDPMLLLGGIVSLAVSGNVEIQKSATIGLILLRTSNWLVLDRGRGAPVHCEIPHQLTLHSLTGSSWKFTVGVAAEASIGFKLNASSNDGKSWEGDAEFKDSDEIEKENKQEEEEKEKEEKARLKGDKEEQERAANARVKTEEKKRKAIEKRLVARNARELARAKQQEVRDLNAIKRQEEEEKKRNARAKKRNEEEEEVEEEEEEEEEEEVGGDPKDEGAKADEDSRDSTLEAFAVEAEADTAPKAKAEVALDPANKATLEATVKAGPGLKYTYETLTSIDPTPAFYDDAAKSTEVLREDLIELLREGSTKALIKLKACEVTQRRLKGSNTDAAAVFDPVQLETDYIITTRRASSESILKSLLFPKNGTERGGLHDGYIPPELEQEAHRLMDALEDFIPDDKDNVKRRIRSYFMRTPCCNVDGHGELKRSWLSTITTSTESVKVAEALRAFRVACAIPTHAEVHAKIEATRRHLLWKIEPYSNDKVNSQSALVVAHVNQNARDFQGTLKLEESVFSDFDPAKSAFAVRDFLSKQTAANSTATAAGKKWAFQKLDDIEGRSSGARVCRCFLMISSHEPSGEAHASAKAQANVKLQGLGEADGEVSAAANLEGRYKQSFSRFQTVAWGRVTDDRNAVPILTSCDTKIRYSSFSLTGSLKASAKAKDELAKKKGKGWDLVDKKGEYAPTRLNRMRYKSSVVVWTKPPGRAGEALVQPGTGLIYGESFVVKNLRKIYEREKDASNFCHFSDKYIVMIAKTLRVTEGELWDFLKDKEVRGHIKDSVFPLEESASLILEAGFRIQPSLLKSLHVKFEEQLLGGHEAPVLAASTLTDLDERAARADPYEREFVELEAFRLRYRKRDHDQTVKGLFKLGFKLGSTELKIKLDRVEEAGADSIIDLRTVFVRSDLIGRKENDAYEYSVPPAILFGQ